MPVENDLQAVDKTIRELVPGLTAALLKVAERMNGTPTAAAAPVTRGPGRPPPTKITLDEVKVVADQLVAEKGRPVWFGLTKTFGIAKLAELPESKYPEFLAAAEVLLAQQDEPESGEL